MKKENSERNFKAPLSCLVIAIKLNMIPIKREINPKRTMRSEYVSIFQFKPKKNTPKTNIPIDNILNSFTITPPNAILPIFYVGWI